MRKYRIITPLLLTVLLLAACNSGRHRPLMGGIRQQITTEETATEPNERAEARPHEPQAEAPKGLEIPAKLTDRAEQLLRRVGYTASYNQELRIPNWVAWHLTADHTSGPYKRQGVRFQEDEEADGPRVTTFDYSRSGYDRGHMCPSGDNKWSREAQEQCFLMTNMCPQTHGLNAGDWNEMEQQCRRWAREYGDIYIVCGPILYRGKHKTIGRSKVTVPEAFFKVVLCMQGEPKAIGFIYKNVDGNRPKSAYVNTVDQVERITGIDFFPALPDKVERQVEQEGDLAEW